MITSGEARHIQYLIEVRDNAVEQMHRFETGTTNYTQQHCEYQLLVASANLANYIEQLTRSTLTSNQADLNEKVHGKSTDSKWFLNQQPPVPFDPTD